jgi:serine protease AprX
MGNIKLSVFLFFFTSHLSAQVNRYMVFFTDKAGTPYAINEPGSFLSQRAIQRRSLNQVTITTEDLPVSPGYVNGVKSTGAKVLYATKWMNGLLIEADNQAIELVNALPYVSSVEYVAPGVRPTLDGRIRSRKLSHETKGNAALTDIQNSIIGLDKMHERGLRGQGVLIAIMDAGFPGADTIRYFKHVFDEGRFDAATSYNFVAGSHNVFAYDAHGTNVWSTIAAYKPNGFIGGAHQANFILFVTEYAPTEYRVEEYNWLFAAERADSAGVDLINTSLGYSTFDDPTMNYTTAQMDGQTSVITRAAEVAASKGIAVVVSAGNEGDTSWKIITAPADGANILAVGSVNSAGIRPLSSSTGPSADGRIKPDVAAMGSGVVIIRSNGTVGSSSGTSFASPLVVSLVAGIRQKLPNLTVKELFDTIRATASQAFAPDNWLGYGIPHYNNFISPPPQSLISVYPNPIKQEATLEFSKASTLAEVRCFLVDSRGATIALPVSWVDDYKFLIDLSHVARGVYLLRLQQGRLYYSHKIIKAD